MWIVSIARRLAQVFRGKGGSALDPGGDPREVLDSSYERQLEMLTKVRRGVADVITSRKRLELQLTQLHQAADKLQAQAVEAVNAGRDDAAREALTRRAGVLTEIDNLSTQRDTLRVEEDKLSATAARLQAKVEAFRSRKEAIKANYAAAEAQTRIGEALSGMSEELGDVNLAMQRAEDRTAQMQARASVVDELMASGVLADASLPAGGGASAALESARHRMDAEAELQALKANKALGSGTGTAIGAGPGTSGPRAAPSGSLAPERHEEGQR